MINIQIPNVAAADRLLEALYVAAGQHPGTARASEWMAIAVELETGIDQLPPQYPFGDPPRAPGSDGERAQDPSRALSRPRTGDHPHEGSNDPQTPAQTAA
ncbi:hypothetical protein [Streptomyces hygroscopicus]|uniref:hypothetical protein n=1 Tax=Streptomyces hygroscopicus TaxID=1912 RepID=UPI0033FADC1C